MPGCSLDKSAKHNWVEDAGGLPDYICRVARAVARGGTDLDHAIPIAISQIKKWAAGVTHDGKGGTPKAAGAKTQAQAKAALAQWEALKAKAHAKSDTKKAVKACEAMENSVAMGEKAAEALYLTMAAIAEAEIAMDEIEHGSVYAGPSVERLVRLSNAKKDWSMDAVRGAYQRKQAEGRRAKRAERLASGLPAYGGIDDMELDDGYRSVHEVHSNHVIVGTGYGDGSKHFKVPYDVKGDGSFEFGKEEPVEQKYVPVKGVKEDAAKLSAGAHIMLAADALVPMGALDRVLSLAGDSPKPNTPAKKYADTKNKKYALDNPAQIRAAWSYINQADNAAKYPLNGVTLSSVKAAIKSAAKSAGITISEG